MRQRPKRPALGSADVLTIELFTEPYIESSSSSSDKLWKMYHH